MDARAARRTVAQPGVRGPERESHAARSSTVRSGLPFQIAVAVAALLAAGATAWLTATADFLAHPGWLAVQKADFVLGPTLVGLYWIRRRPESRFGLILVGFGFVGTVYALQSSSNPWLFGAGLLWENVVGFAAYVLILTFPTGRLDGLVARSILLVALVGAVLPAIAIDLLLPQLGAGGSISGCRTLCPENAFAVTSKPALALDLYDSFRYVVMAVAVATAALLVWRFLHGTPPQRRALAIGTPIALLFLSLQVVFHLLALVAPNATDARDVVAWAFAGARALLWYGFLAALIAAELFAARELERLVARSLRRPSQQDLEVMLREPLGDPKLKLWFLEPTSGTWVGADGERFPEPPAAVPGLGVTVVDNRGEQAVALLHDAQLADDPELLRAAGAIALLAAENAELDAGWSGALEELRKSRARSVRAGDNERRRIERDLHDGVQQRLVAIAIYVGLAADDAAGDPAIRARLDEIGVGVDEALRELRELSHGIHPPILTELGIVAALRRLRLRETADVTISAHEVGRHPPELESAVYYCCTEAIQNAVKHGRGPVHVSVELAERAERLEFRIADNGPGFDVPESHVGLGLQSMRDRIGALDGRLSIVSAPGRGTVVSGSVALAAATGEGDPVSARRQVGTLRLGDDQ
jgi:signal transduction histidine kinase